MNNLRFIATVSLQIGNDIQEGRGKEHRSALRKNDERFVYVKKRLYLCAFFMQTIGVVLSKYKKER